LLVLALLQPGPAAGVHAVLDAPVPAFAAVLLEALELLQRGQQRPGLAADQPQVAAAAAGAGLEGEPALGDATGLGTFALDLPVRGLRLAHRAFEHRADRVGALGGLEVPGERDEVAPVGVVAEHRGGGGMVAAGDGGAERVEPALDGCGGCAHRRSPVSS